MCALRPKLLQIVHRGGTYCLGTTLLSQGNQSAIGYSICGSQKFHQCAVDTARYEVHPERIEQIEASPSGWVPPSDPPPNFLFNIRRSKFNNIPVYTSVRNGKTRVITIVRNVTGDLKELERCLRCKLGAQQHYQINEITSTVRIRGNHKPEVLRWLKELGF